MKSSGLKYARIIFHSADLVEETEGERERVMCWKEGGTEGRQKNNEEGLKMRERKGESVASSTRGDKKVISERKPRNNALTENEKAEIQATRKGEWQTA